MRRARVVSRGGGGGTELVDEVAETWAIEGYAGIRPKRRRRDANQGGRRSFGELGARSMVHRDVVRARARPVPASGAMPPAWWDALEAISVGTNGSCAAGAFGVLALGEVEVGSGRASPRASRRARARPSPQTRRDRDAGGRAVAELLPRWAAVSAPVRERELERRLIHSFANRARELAVAVHDAFPGVQIHRTDDVAAIARRLRDAPGVQGPFLAALHLLRGVRSSCARVASAR